MKKLGFTLLKAMTILTIKFDKDEIGQIGLKPALIEWYPLTTMPTVLWETFVLLHITPFGGVLGVDHVLTK